MALDLASFASIRRSRPSCSTGSTPLDVLVNNAGLILRTRR